MMLRLFVSVFSQRRYGRVKGYLSVRPFHKNVSQEPSSVSTSRLKQFFKQQYLSIVEGHACIIADCPICSAKKNGSKIYINKTTGYFVCDHCKYVGIWSILEKFLSANNANGNGKNKAKTLESFKMSLQLEEDFTQEWEDLKKTCQNISDLSIDEYKDVLDKLSLPNVSQKDMQRLKCIYQSSSNTLYFPVVGLGNSLAGYKSISTSPEMEETVPNFNISGCITYKGPGANSDGSGIVVETIYDLLALVSQDTKSTVICLPYNLQSLPQQLLPSLEEYKKLILWFGNDSTSWYMTRHIAKKLGEARCHFVNPTDTQPRPKKALDMGYKLKSILRNTQAISHQSITTFQQLREDVLSDLQNIEKVQGIKWKKFPSLNKILKGHRRGEFTILTGPTGSGKTTFVSEYSLDLAMQGVNTLWGSFEITNTRLARTMLQQMAGVNLRDHIEKFDVYADTFEKLPIYFMTFHGQQSIKVVMDAVEHATYVHDIGHVVIDNIQFMMGMDETRHSDRFYKQDTIVAKFRNFATKYNCHVTVIIHPRKERDCEELTTSSIFGGAKASQEADNVLIIQDRRLSSIRGKKYLQVAKNRYSGDLGIMVMEFDKESLSYAQKKKPKHEVTEDEKKGALKKRD